MGNWHCIPSGCAEVVYQEYESAKIRWQYPGENWQEIEGDDYHLQQTSGTFTGGQCNIRYRAYCVWDGVEKVQTSINGKVTSVTCSVSQAGNSYSITATNDKGETRAGHNYHQYVQDKTYYEIRVRPFSTSQQDNCGTLSSNCKFTVYLQGNVVYTETRNICPVVERLPCKLSDLHKSIEIKKLPYLEKVEVVPYAYSAYRLPGIPSPIAQADPIPPECLNIYNNAIYVIPPPIDALKDPDAVPFDSFVTQICSSSGCPPPEYQVICDCNYQNPCKSCPEGTCPVECDDHICCYNNYGVSILEIPLSNYCGGIQ